MTPLENFLTRSIANIKPINQRPALTIIIRAGVFVCLRLTRAARPAAALGTLLATSAMVWWGGTLRLGQLHIQIPTFVLHVMQLRDGQYI